MDIKAKYNKIYIVLASLAITFYIMLLYFYVRYKNTSSLLIFGIYFLVILMLIINYLLIKNIKNRKVQIFSAILNLILQLSFGIFLTALWFYTKIEDITNPNYIYII